MASKLYSLYSLQNQRFKINIILAASANSKLIHCLVTLDGSRGFEPTLPMTRRIWCPHATTKPPTDIFFTCCRFTRTNLRKQPAGSRGIPECCNGNPRKDNDNFSLVLFAVISNIFQLHTLIIRMRSSVNGLQCVSEIRNMYGFHIT